MWVLREFLLFLIALVWAINGLVCKVQLLVPRHEQIVGTILGATWARELTCLIGLPELVLACWVVSGWRPRLVFYLQVIAVMSMNLLEFFLATEYLLWGKINLLFAILFIVLLYLVYFRLHRPLISCSENIPSPSRLSSKKR